MAKSRYWCFIDKKQGAGWEKVRRDDGAGWGYSLTKYQRRAVAKQAAANDWGYRSKKIPKKSSKPPRSEAKRFPNATHATRHFAWSEFACKDGTQVPVSLRSDTLRLARGLEALRRELGGAVQILSGYRTVAYNQQIGGASQSQHTKGTAADLVVSPWGQDRLVEAAEQIDVFYNGGIGVYPSGGVHVDVRGYKARWTSF